MISVLLSFSPADPSDPAKTSNLLLSFECETLSEVRRVRL
jgi:hypothetical protein